MTFADIVALVEEKCDGRSLGFARHIRWADLVRSEVARNSLSAGFRGLYFLYKEATVVNGSTAGTSRYRLPDDFVDDLAAWYDSVPLIKADPSIMDVTQYDSPSSSGSEPTWFTFRGQELEILPAPSRTGDEIKLFYNGLPEGVTGDGFTDYFLNQWPHIHVFGMAESALDYIGASALAQKMRGRFQEEVQRLMLDNRRFWLKNQRIRLQNWDEFEEKQRYLFPQFGNLSSIRSEST